MREIKYQVWHKPTKTIQVVALIDFNNKRLDTYGIDEPIYNIPFEDVDLREYTGLKDKNGKEIFNGAIVKKTYINFNSFSRKNEEKFTLYKVNWDIEFSCFRPFASNPYECSYTGDYEDARINSVEVEVIGNYFENPELLNCEA